MALSKNKLKYIRSLSLKKYRDEHRAFVAEGPKVVGDLAGTYPCKLLLGTAAYLAAHPQPAADEVVEVTQKELEQASALRAPRDVLAVFGQPAANDGCNVAQLAASELCLALDGVQDPGNMGTIVRVADWFGIRHVLCSPDCADVFSPKTVQATMGALARVRVHVADIAEVIGRLPREIPVYGTFLDGDDMYGATLSAAGIIVMGSEGHGISVEVAERVSRRLYIPNYPAGCPTSESLNVAIATAVVCAEFRRRGVAGISKP